MNEIHSKIIYESSFYKLRLMNSTNITFTCSFYLEKQAVTICWERVLDHLPRFALKLTLKGIQIALEDGNPCYQCFFFTKSK